MSNDVSYSDLPPEKEGNIHLTGHTVKFPDGRTVSLYRDKTGSEKGNWFRITSPLADNKVSLLKFRLSDEAAFVLAALILEHWAGSLKD